MPPAADVQGSDPAKNDSDVSTPGQLPRAPSPSTVPRSGTQTIASLSLDVSEEQSDLPPSPSSLGEKSDIAKNDLEKGKGDTESDHPPAPSTALQPAEQPVPALRLEGGFAGYEPRTVLGISPWPHRDSSYKLDPERRPLEKIAPALDNYGLIRGEPSKVSRSVKAKDADGNEVTIRKDFRVWSYRAHLSSEEKKARKKKKGTQGDGTISLKFPDDALVYMRKYSGGYDLLKYCFSYWLLATPSDRGNRHRLREMQLQCGTESYEHVTDFNASEEDTLAAF